jgi:hypothetical protein
MKLHVALKTRLVLAALLLSCLPHSATGQGNLVVNGGFDTDASGWVMTNVDISWGGWSSAGNPGGSFILDNSPSSSTEPTIGQTVNSLTPGDTYVVSGDYQMLGGKNFANVDSLGVAIDGTFLFETVAPTDPTDHSWYSFNFLYTATSSSALLSLSSKINGTDFYYGIDNIVMAAIPEPHSLALLVLGGLFFIYQCRRS